MADISKWFEEKVAEQGDILQSESKVKWHRFPDAYAARGALPSQPGDFLLLSTKAASLIEVKTSDETESLKSCASTHIRSEQVGHHLLWNRAGHPSYFMFMSDASGVIELWNGNEVAEARKAGTQLKKHYLLDRGDYSSEVIYSMLSRIINRSYY